MAKKGCWSAALACGALVLLSSISVNWRLEGKLVDPAGAPITDAFVFYYYSAGTKLIWPWAHHEGPVLTRTDEAGRFAIPARMRLRFPLITLMSPVRVHLSAYAPRLHNSCELLDPAESDSYCAKPLRQASGERAFQLLSLSRPAQRFRTLWLLTYSEQALLPGSPSQRQALVDAARKEYRQFLDENGDAIFANSPNEWGHIPTRDWTQEPGENRPWTFFLQRVPFYGITMEAKLSQMERQAN